jgi:hypothetical protein
LHDVSQSKAFFITFASLFSLILFSVAFAVRLFEAFLFQYFLDL